MKQSKEEAYEFTYKEERSRDRAIERLQKKGYVTFNKMKTKKGFELRAWKSDKPEPAAPKIKAEIPEEVAPALPDNAPLVKSPKTRKKLSKKAKRNAAIKEAKREAKSKKSSGAKPTKKNSKKITKKTKRVKKTKAPKNKDGSRRSFGAGYWNTKNDKIAHGRNGEEIDISGKEFAITRSGVLVVILEDHGDNVRLKRYATGAKSEVKKSSVLTFAQYRKIEKDRQTGEAQKFKIGEEALFLKKRYTVESRFKDLVLLTNSKGSAGWIFTGLVQKTKTKKVVKKIVKKIVKKTKRSKKTKHSKKEAE